jgi:hypothetical protein
MPWKPSYTRQEARNAVDGAASWKAVTDVLGVAYHGRNIATLRRWCARWEIDVSHLPDRRGVMGTDRRYTEAEARGAIAESMSWAETLRRLGYCQTGANHELLKQRAARWDISTEHFDPYANSRGPRPKRPLEEVLVEGSTYSRSSLKQRLYDAGLKLPRCELCGQGEEWRGQRMGLILDHINGVRDDNRLENLRIICPNCAATLDTHCGRKLHRVPRQRRCKHCQGNFRPKYASHRFCSNTCFHAWQRVRGKKLAGVPKLDSRRVERPPYEQLLQEIAATSYVAVARKYGVSDNAIRKWVRQYEREAARGDDLADAA